MSTLPSLNAALNATSAVLLTTGFILIRQGRRAAHRRCMLGAVAAFLLFLVSYVIYNYPAGTTRFGGTGWVRPVYFVVLSSHTVLALVIVPLVVITLLRALSGRFSLHRSIARWTYPLWMYVSITGVLIYLVLYHLFPPAI